MIPAPPTIPAIHSRDACLGLIRAVDWRTQPDGSSTDWPHILPLAAHNRLQPFLYDRLRDNQTADPDVLRQLEGASRQSFAEVSFHLQMLSEIARCFQGFNWVLLRGPVLGKQFYRKLHIRPFVDLDILIAEDEVETSLALLRSLNFQSPEGALDDNYYRATHLHVHLKKKVGPILGAAEIHWRLDHPFMLYSIDPAGILQRRQSLELAGSAIPVPEPHDLLLTVAVHMVKHAVNLHSYLQQGEVYRLAEDGELLRILDVGLAYDQMAARLDWDLLAQRAEQWGSQAAISDCLLAVEQLWPGSVNADHIRIFGQVRRRTWVRHLALPLQSQQGKLREDLFFRPVRLLDLIDYLLPPHEYFERNQRRATVFVRLGHLFRSLPQLGKAILSLIIYGAKQRLNR